MKECVPWSPRAIALPTEYRIRCIIRLLRRATSRTCQATGTTLSCFTRRFHFPYPNGGSRCRGSGRGGFLRGSRLGRTGQQAEASNPVGRRGFYCARLRRLAELPARRRQTSFRSHANSAAMSHRPVWSLWVRSFALSGESASSGYIKQSVDQVSECPFRTCHRTQQDCDGTWHSPKKARIPTPIGISRRSTAQTEDAVCRMTSLGVRHLSDEQRSATELLPVTSTRLPCLSPFAHHLSDKHPHRLQHR